LRLGSPLGSALAVALAKASGKPVVIEDEQGTGAKSVLIVYRMLEEGGQASP
jgi:flavin-dependent dehydrogenase